MKERVIRIAGKYKAQLGAVRLLQGWKGAEAEGLVWLRGPLQSHKSWVMLLALPAEATFTMDDQHRLFPLGKQTPVAMLPELNWQSLADFLPVELPVSALPGCIDRRHIGIRLVRSAEEREKKVLKTDLATWKAYTGNAPQIRLQPLRFAVDTLGNVLVAGNPLPSIPGCTYWRNHDLLIPSGYDFDPPILAELLHARLNDGTDSLVIWEEHGGYSTVPTAAFVPAKRNIIRTL
ncbi:hypothetical protein [Mucilaginibacter sp. 22184]|uniref:hypothetical protein n=1 Tax=Mucilaginibacter sp. 22184 TaxID=3453887 RepID=UPI003F84ED63